MYVVLCTCCSLPTRPRSGHNVVVMQCGGACMLSASLHPPKSYTSRLGVGKGSPVFLRVQSVTVEDAQSWCVCVCVRVCRQKTVNGASQCAS